LVIVDSSVWIDFLNDGTGAPHTAALYALLADGADIAVTEVNLMEVLRGIKDNRQHAKVKRDMLSLPVLSAAGVDTYIAASDMYRAARKSGITVNSSLDFLIAAIGMENNAVILHHDSDFDKLSKVIPGLRTITPQAILNR
jgi:predicted nucleic acid-binding protein